METLIIQSLLIPLTLYVVKFYFDRKAKKEDAEKQAQNELVKNLLKMVNDYDARLDEIEKSKASIVDVTEIKEDLSHRTKEIWTTIREYQNKTSGEIGELKGRVLK